jgi:Tfp pilus assembly protein PilO
MAFDSGQFDLKQEAGSREKIYFAVILLLIVVSFARWLYLPKMKEIKTTQVQIKSQKLQVDTLSQFAKLKLPEVQAPQEITEVKSGTKFDKAVAESMRSPQQVVAEIVRMLTASNMLNNITLKGMQFGSEVNKGIYSQVPVSIDLEGRYSGILAYLNRMEQFGKLVVADNVDVVTKDGNLSAVQCKINASIYVVHAGGSAATPASAQAGGAPTAAGAAQVKK